VLQTDDSTFGAIDPALALRPPIAASQSTAALRPRPPAAQTTAAISPRAAPALIRPTSPAADPMAEYYARVRQHESGGDDTISNGVAYGRYQFTPQTWLGVAIKHPELGLDKTNILDPAKQDEAMRALTADNAAVLQKNGLEVTPENLFMLHFLGAGGGPKFLKAFQADPSANAAALFPLETRYNPTIFHKPDGQPRSLGEVYGLMTKTFGGESPPGNGVRGNLQFAEGPKTVASDAVVDADLPPGAVAIGDDSDLPPGAVPIGDNPYAVGRSKLAGPVEQTSQVLAIDPAGNPAFADPKDQGEFQRGLEEQQIEEKEIGKGLTAGAARDITGPATLLPGGVGRTAQEATNYLNQTGYPLARGIGGMAPFAALGVPAMTALQPSVAAALIGGAGGLSAGTQSSSNEPTAVGRLNEKLPAMLEYGLGGAVTGGLSPLAGIAAKEVKGLYKTATGAYEREAKKTVEELRTGVDAETGKALSAKDKAKREVILDQRAGERKLATQEAEYQRADQAAQQIAKEFAARPIMTSDVLGNELHEAAARDFREAKDFRKSPVSEGGSGFKDAVNSDGGRPSIDTKGLISRVNSVERRFGVDLSDLKARLKTLPDVKGQKAEPRVSIERARDVAEVMGSRVAGSTSGVGHALEDLKKAVVDQIETTHPMMKAARKRYAELSRDTDFYERSGAGKKAVLEDPYSGENLVDTTKITAALLNNTEGGAEVAARLVAKNPNLLDSFRKYLNYQLKKAAGDNPVPTQANFRAVMDRNRLAMERLGMAELKTPEQVEKAFDLRKETGPVTIEHQGKSYTGASRIDAVQQAARASGTSVDRVWDAVTPETRAPVAPGAAAKSAEPPLLKEFGGLKTRVEENQQALKSADEVRTETQKSIEQLAKDKKTATSARDSYFKMQSWLKEAKVSEVPDKITGIVNKLHDDHFISDAQMKQFVTMARESKDSLEAATKAKRFVRYVILPVIVGVTGFGGEYLYHKVRP
jgi:hypothetical protein